MVSRWPDPIHAAMLDALKKRKRIAGKYGMFRYDTSPRGDRRRAARQRRARKA